MDIETARKFLDAAIAHRERKVARMLRAGKTISEIARTIGVSRQRAQMIVKKIKGLQ